MTDQFNLLPELSLSPKERDMLERLDVQRFAFLSLTNANQIQNTEFENWGYAFLTEKSVYSWSSVLTYWFNNRKRPPGLKEIKNKIDMAVLTLVEQTHRQDILDWTNQPSVLGRLNSAFYKGGTPNFSKPNIGQLKLIIEKNVKDLENTGHLKDPFIETFSGMAIMLAGLVPYSFTKRTELGDSEYLAIKALLWEYERYRSEDQEIMKAHFRMNAALDYLRDRIRISFGKTKPKESSGKISH